MLTLYQPRIFREFELEGTLGSGGFGVVCKARHKTCKQTYAIKIIPFQEDENLNREFQLLSVLNHPNVVGFHNVWFDHDAKQPEETTDPVNDNLELDPSTDSSESADLYGINIANRYCFIQMELCDTSLRELLYDKEFDQEAVPGYVLQICEGLKHIHDNKIIHRDLKPENIFLTNNIIKIGDFGLSKSLESDDTDDERLKFYNTVCGTPIYMAPEMNNGKEIAKYDTKVDMYSLGIILLEVMQKMTFHHFTFIIKDYQETGYFDSNNTLTLNKDNKDIIKNLLQFDPKKRFDCNQVLEKLNELKMLGTDKFRQIVSQKSVRMEQVYLYDRILSNIDLRSMDLRNVVLKKAEEIFELHGGTPLQLPIFGPVKTADTKDVNVISKHGSGVSVGTCFRKRFAEYVNYSGANIESNRYFSLGTYFTQSDAFIPNEVQECSFDIVATEEKSEFFIDAEILYIAKEIIDLLPSVKFKETIFYINHKLFYRALKSEISNVFYKYKKELFDTFAKASVEQLSKEDFEAELKNINISPYQKKRLLSLYQPISLDNTEELNKLRKNKFRNTAIEKIQKLAGVLEIFGINKENIYIFPLLNTQTCYYSGIFSQVYMKKTNSDVKMTLVASGGRYDKYVKDKYSVVGITFHVENITKNIISHFQFVTVIVRENETEIDCLPILKFLWNSGIPCRISLKSKNEGKDLLLSYYKLYPHKENVVLQLQTESFQNRNFYIGAMNHKLIKVIQGFITFFSNVN